MWAAIIVAAIYNVGCLRMFSYLQKSDPSQESINTILSVGWFITLPIALGMMFYKWCKGEFR